MKPLLHPWYLIPFVLMGCSEKAHKAEVARAVSPDGKFEAVLIESNGGATTSFGYEVDVGAKGTKSPQKVATLYGAVRNENAYGANLRWPDSSSLRVGFLRARAVEFNPAVTIDGRKISIDIIDGVTDPSAPPGGMEYNIKKPLPRTP